MSRAEGGQQIIVAFLVVVSLGSAAPAHAQLSGSVSVASDDRWRGRSLSAGRPVASVTIAYDAPQGSYIDATATAAWTDGDDFALTGGAINVGHVWRTTQGLAISVGATRRQFTSSFSGGRVAGYSEIYTGVSGRSLAVRLSYSPDYFTPGSHTVYLGTDAVVRLTPDLRVTGHAGALAYLSPIRTANLRSISYDYSLGMERRFRALDVRLTLSSGGPGLDFYRGRGRDKTAITIGIAYTF